VSVLRAGERDVRETSRLGRVGHDNGRLVLYFERCVSARVDDVWRLLTASPERGHWISCGNDRELRDETTVQPPFWPVDLDSASGRHQASGVTREWQAPTVFEWTTDRATVRWELAGVNGRTDVVCIAWIDSVDVQQAALDGAGYHMCFTQFVGLVETGTLPLQRGAQYFELTSDYAEVFAAALADTD
jgi:uncharacterized protein YndB with AHSA1/START domain